MRKLLSFLLAAVVVMAWIVPAKAAEPGIRMADVTVQEAETVYIPVSLQTAVTGTAMGLTYTYDSTVLEIVSEECRWIPTGTLKDFSKTSHQAVWASNGEKKLSGDICVLAFRILNMQAFQKTEVSCSITVKSGAETVGVYQDTVRIAKVCAHQFGDWTSSGTSGHVRKCSLCKEEELQSHDWGNGTQSTDSERPNVTVITYRCKTCAAEKRNEILGGNQEIVPAYPEATMPSEPVKTMPEETKPQPSYPPEHEILPTSPRESETTKPSSGASDKLAGNGGSSNQSQSGKNQSSIVQPKDYNQNQQENAEKSTIPKAEPHAGNGNAAEMVSQSDSMEATHPMAIKVEEPAETLAENETAVKTKEKEETSLLIWFVAGTVLAVSAVGAGRIFVIKKRKV